MNDDSESLLADNDRSGSRCVSDNEEGWNETAHFLIGMVDKTIDMETSRCEALKKMCEVMLTATSIMSVALLAIADPLFSFFGSDKAMQYGLLVLYAIVLTLLIGSMILVVLSMARFRYTALGSPEALLKDIGNMNEILQVDVMARSYALAQESVYKGLEEKNDKVRNLLIASQFTLIAALAITLIGGLVLLAGGFALLD